MQKIIVVQSLRKPPKILFVHSKITISQARGLQSTLKYFQNNSNSPISSNPFRLTSH